MSDADPRELAIETIQWEGWSRLQFTLILAATTAAGLGVVRALTWLEVEPRPLRWGLAVLPAYGVMLLMLGAWSWANRRFHVPRPGGAPRPASVRASDLAELAWAGLQGCLQAPWAVVLMVPIVLAAMISQAPAILVDLLAELGAAGLLASTARRLPVDGWLRVLLRRTWWVPLLVGLLACMAGFFVDAWLGGRPR